MKKIGVLTSSRADYGIYVPLLKALSAHEIFDPELLVFGSHLSHFHGYSVEDIERDGFTIRNRVQSLLLGDDEVSVAGGIALTALKFAEIWEENRDYFDLVFCLGDRYEMFGAVQAGIPFGIKFAHIHGGETTEGAIDNIYRHAITLSSSLHFTSADMHSKRVESLVGSGDGIVTTGALSLDNTVQFRPDKPDEFKKRWGIDLERPTILVTVHPETVSPENNRKHAHVIFKFLSDLVANYQIVVTMPNTDTLGSVYRKQYETLRNTFPNDVHLVDNFGTQAYFTCMKYSRLVVGNSSSGIIEAASFGKYVLNIGDRQKGRLKGDNVFDAPFNLESLTKLCKEALQKGDYTGENLFYRDGAASRIISKLEDYFGFRK